VGNLQHFSILCLSIERPNNNQNKLRSTFDFIFARWHKQQDPKTSKDAAVLADLAANHAPKRNHRWQADLNFK